MKTGKVLLNIHKINWEPIFELSDDNNSISKHKIHKNKDYVLEMPISENNGENSIFIENKYRRLNIGKDKLNISHHYNIYNELYNKYMIDSSGIMRFYDIDGQDIYNNDIPDINANYLMGMVNIYTNVSDNFFTDNELFHVIQGPLL